MEREDQVAPAPADHRADAPGRLDGEPEGIVEELLIEEISIDGMCGVY